MSSSGCTNLILTRAQVLNTWNCCWWSPSLSSCALIRQSSPADDTQTGLCSMHTWNCVHILKLCWRWAQKFRLSCEVDFSLSHAKKKLLQRWPWRIILFCFPSSIPWRYWDSSSAWTWQCLQPDSCVSRDEAVRKESRLPSWRSLEHGEGFLVRIWLIVGHDKRTPGLGYSCLFFHKLKQSQSSWNVQTSVRVMETVKEDMDCFSSLVSQLMWDCSSILSLQALKH